MHDVDHIRSELSALLGPSFDATQIGPGQGRATLTSWSGAHADSDVLWYAPAWRQDAGEEIAQVVTWFASQGYQVRPIGTHVEGSREPLHNWSPLHLPAKGATPAAFPAAVAPSKTLYLSFDVWFGVTDIQPAAATARVLAGTRMRDLLHFLHAPHATDAPPLWRGDGMPPTTSFTLAVTPAPGVLTLGGVLAIGGHGTGLSAPNQMRRGSMSGQVRSLVALAWNTASDAFEAKRFTHQDAAFPALVASLGRAIVLEVELELVPDHLLQIELLDVARDRLYGTDATDAESFARLVQETAGAETLSFRPPRKGPRRKRTFVAVWRRAPMTPTRPLWGAPNNPLSKLTHVPNSLAWAFRAFVRDWPTMSNTAYGRAEKQARRFAARRLDGSNLPLPSGEARSYVSSDTLQMEPVSFAIVCPADDIQAVVHAFDRALTVHVDNGRAGSLHYLAAEVRCTDLDRPYDRGGSLLSACSPPAGLAPGRHVVVWVTAISTQQPSGIRNRGDRFRKLQEALAAACQAGGWLLRPEWSKGWCYTAGGAWTADEVDRRAFLDTAFPGPDGKTAIAVAKELLDGVDPQGVFRAPFHVEIGL